MKEVLKKMKNKEKDVTLDKDSETLVDDAFSAWMNENEEELNRLLDVDELEDE